MTQNRELAVIAMSKELGRAQALGLDRSVPQPICHRFFSISGNLSDLAKHLRLDGFKIWEDNDASMVEARRSEVLEYSSLQILTLTMCDLADQFAASYDGAKLDN